MNKGVYVALISIGMAQFLKIPIHFLKTKKWDKGLFFQTGGMPSSHSAGVSSLTTFIALKRGMPTIDFALSLIYGLIVMYDAQGIRRQTGELTLKVNDLGDLVDKINTDKNIAFKEKQPKKLKEMLGHQPQEVLGGALLGILIGFLGHILTKKKRSFLHR
ncbi:divergent PAP2 family protein [Cytobacillus oceanisediminis]|uniref:Divergent PAP2 family protein n=2 Tax=Niallia TaxID=2837506 RepID=A0A941GPV7_NIACI|nr:MULTISPECIES: divergent PAP2 family protein [Bacillaceae]EOR23530.1 acid phosphatase/vanadium-dependent haloperoxidase [Niallia nealsonii AAU1]MBQ6448634.1 divergent PAP2 family protein [Bacillus sp. (in: firmicutes)]MDU1844420.1 divergent PAP2 family protein [Niallia nealsonii]MBZ9535932.1 divergent PAP2 family protein [Cytobacillus oceanisediminis]MCB5238811.1 divergent PAP2 family protein [Niallia circulans]